jgi:hypothetical protein
MAKTEDTPSDDVPILVAPADEHGHSQVMCLYDDCVEMGELRPLKDGVPIMGGEPVMVSGSGPRRTMQFLGEKPPRKGPAKVNSPAFQAGWDNIFGKKEVGQA